MVFLTLEVNVDQLETSNEHFTLIYGHYQGPCNPYIILIINLLFYDNGENDTHL